MGDSIGTSELRSSSGRSPHSIGTSDIQCQCLDLGAEACAACQQYTDVIFAANYYMHLHIDKATPSFDRDVAPPAAGTSKS